MLLVTSHSEAERGDNEERRGDEGKEIEEKGGERTSCLTKSFCLTLPVTTDITRQQEIVVLS